MKSFLADSLSVDKSKLKGSFSTQNFALEHLKISIRLSWNLGMQIIA